MRPYYEHAGITIYHGDCREILPTLSAPAIITDPVWPRPTKLLAASGDPWQLFREMCEAIPASVLRMTVHLGVISDPRFLFPVPERLPFFRVCWLAQIPCSFVGRVLNGANVAYIFGQPPAGTGILPGECLDTGGGTYRNGLGRNRSQKAYHAVRSEMPHPAARRLGHLRWLVKHFAGGPVIDPFGGSGTTALACKAQGWPCTLIEIEERYCEVAAERLQQEVLGPW